MTRARCMAYAFTVFALGALLSYAGVPILCIESALLRNCFTHCNPHRPAHYAPQSTFPLSGAPKFAGSPCRRRRQQVPVLCCNEVHLLQSFASRPAACQRRRCERQSRRQAIGPRSLLHDHQPVPVQHHVERAGGRPLRRSVPLFPAFVAMMPQYQGFTGHRISHHGIRPATY